MSFTTATWPTARGLCLALAFLPLLGSLAAALQPRKSSHMAAVDPEARPALAFQQYMTDLGNLDENRSSGAAAFVFTNRSAHPVHINKITPSCGCLTTRITTVDYAPGAQGEFFIQLDSVGENPGPKQFDAQVVYETRDKVGRKIHEYTEKVWFKVIIPAKKLIVEPAAVIIYQAASGDPTSRVVQLIDYREGDFEIVSTETSHPQVFAKVMGLKAGASLKTQEVEVIVQGTFPDKPVKALVQIRTNDPTYQLIKIPMLIQGMPAAKAE